MGSLIALRNYVRNRWIDKTHALTSKLKRGQWYDFDERLLHCMFDGLVDFVECEAGMRSLEWQTTLTAGKEWHYLESDPKYNDPIQQALDAKEIISLYKWWKDIRPQRPDPYDQEELDSMDCVQMEQDQMDEDTKMMVRLVKIRGSMWT